MSLTQQVLGAMKRLDVGAQETVGVEVLKSLKWIIRRVDPDGYVLSVC